MDAVLAKKLLLIGAGHAHIGLLRRLADKRLENIESIKVTLLTEQPQALYSGMLPGWMAGHYSLSDISINAQALCVQAGVRFIQQPLAAIDASAKQVTTSDSTSFDYDVLSLNTGADTDLSWLKTDNSVKTNSDTNANANASTDDHTIIAIRPLHHFVQQWQQVLDDARDSSHYKLAVIGAGAAAAELVMAAQFALQQINPNHQAYLICGNDLLLGFHKRFKRQAIEQLNRNDVEIVYERATNYSAGKLHTSAQSLPMDAVIAATGVTGSAWSTHTDLQTVDGGFIAVNEVQQSISHPNVFAVGDVATRVDREMAHSGVHAVFGGVVEADNLLAYLADEPLKTYQPKNRTLYLLSCGDKYAIGSWGKYSIQGHWVWQLKRYIDKRFVKS